MMMTITMTILMKIPEMKHGYSVHGIRYSSSSVETNSTCNRCGRVHDGCRSPQVTAVIATAALAPPTHSRDLGGHPPPVIHPSSFHLTSHHSSLIPSDISSSGQLSSLPPPTNINRPHVLLPRTTRVSYVGILTGILPPIAAQ
jgi:hypothetical protein